jgi:hypothetical protein
MKVWRKININGNQYLAIIFKLASGMAWLWLKAASVSKKTGENQYLKMANGVAIVWRRNEENQYAARKAAAAGSSQLGSNR